MSSASTPAHRVPPQPAWRTPSSAPLAAAGGQNNTAEEVASAVSKLAATIEKYDADGSTQRVPPAPPSARRLVYLASPRTHTAPTFLTQQSPKQTYIVRPGDAGGHRAARQMGHETVKLPYSQPWYKPQLDETLAELDRCKRQVATLKKALDEVAKERNAAIETGRRSTETISQLCDEAVVREKRKTRAVEEAAAMKVLVDQGEKERKLLEAENARLRARVQTVQSEVEDLKASMSAYVEDRIKAERAAADSSVAAAQAQGEARAARHEALQVVKERDSARAEAKAAQEVEQERLERLTNEGARAELERRARLEALVVPVKPATRKELDERAAKLSYMEADDLASETAKYTAPDEIWSLLEPRNFDGQHDSPIVLLSANWLRTQRPRRLPERQKLPAEALIPIRSLRTIHATIEKGMAKNMCRPMPIICMLLPHSALAVEGSVHPDPEGNYLEMVVNALDQRWPEFTKRRGGTQSTGVTDMGVFIDWASIYMAPLNEVDAKNKGRRTPHENTVFGEALKGVHTLFAHTLTTVWMIPEGHHAVGPKEVRYKEAWPTLLYMVATMIKPTNISEAAAWPQLLDLGGVVSTTALPIPNGHYEQERACRRAPPEPLTFDDDHEHGHCIGADKMVSRIYREALFGLLAGVEELDFRKCGWGDEESAWLALVLPLCGRLQRLLLSGNAIGNTGAAAIAAAIGNGAVRNLTTLALDNNLIGDAGASSLFEKLSPGDGGTENGGVRPLQELKNLTLANNSINDSSIAALVGAITVGALKGCKVNLDGNPATKVSRKGVKKALKKAKNLP